MRSILAKILVWSLGTLALSIVAYWALERALSPAGPPQGDPFWSMVELVEDDAYRAYERGGPAALAEHLRQLDRRLPGTHYLVDLAGRDLVSGDDRSDWLGPHPGRPRPRSLPDGRVAMVGPPRLGRYRFISVLKPWFGPPDLLPYFGVVVLVILGMGCILAAHLGVPLRRLRGVMDRFGRGDLAARARSTRRDEIGALARTFDDMAERIQTLLAAERRLLQDVSHELRSPLARLGFAVALARTSADQDGAFDRIERDVNRLNQLVGQLLELTRAEGDAASLRREPVAMDDLVRDVADDGALEARAKDCDLVLRAAPLTLEGDPELLRRAVENVVRNAVRHAPAGTTIDMSLDIDGNRALLSVRDRGEGVPLGELEAIFTPFYRVEGDRSRLSGGVGLGLAIARRAVELHGGTIEAANVEPGLRVEIRLPAKGSVNEAIDAARA